MDKTDQTFATRVAQKSLKEFLKDRLRLSPVFLGYMGDVSLKRVASEPGSKIGDEVVILFSSVQVRDSVRICLLYTSPSPRDS